MKSYRLATIAGLAGLALASTSPCFAEAIQVDTAAVGDTTGIDIAAALGSRLDDLRFHVIVNTLLLKANFDITSGVDIDLSLSVQLDIPRR